MRLKFFIASCLIFLCLPGSGQDQWSSSRIQHEINKLPVRGTVLYIAAHPDDENTRMISWLANEKKFRTAYLSLTRGDGGQNLIGNELGVKLGIIRTHELMAARAIDGGEQYFTRAFDFGYSKTAGETFTKWDRDSILSDMVFVIRLLQPDVIITRFPVDNYQTHGHHTASAILAVEAYEAAADPKRFPEHFSYGVSTWAVKHIFYNASTWWNKDLPQLAAKNDSFFSVDVGTYSPLLGTSFTEMAGKSRSMHKSQGFGSSEPAGEAIEYLKLLHSRIPVQSKDPFASACGMIENRVLLEQLSKLSYNTDNVSLIDYLTKLVNAKTWFESQASSPLFAYRAKQVDEIIRQSLGLKISLNAEKLEFAQGDTVSAKLSILLRLGVNVHIDAVTAQNGVKNLEDLIMTEFLEKNRGYESTLLVYLDPAYFSQMPWIRNGKTEAMFNNSWNDGGILPGTNDDVSISVTLSINGTLFTYTVPLTYTHVDPVKGELVDPVLIKPALELESSSENLLFINTSKTTIPLKLKANRYYSGPFIMQLDGPFSAKKPFGRNAFFTKDTAVNFMLELESLSPGESGSVSFRANLDLRKRSVIEYDHIGIIPHCETPKLTLNTISLQQKNNKIAYLQGAGDEVDHYLRLAGYAVTTISQAELTAESLKNYHVLILGIRSYNTLEITAAQQKAIFEFAENGGNVIIQYLTNRGINKNFAPYPIEIGRGRVTEENAPMVAIHPDEAVLNFPNKLGPEDYFGWVQERGLYFVSSYDSLYRPVFCCNDQGEQALDGILVIADYGKGSFMYTGLSFFRQLPAGVPGAYRLLGNLIDYEATGTD
ncbi:MAG: PIG-L family deacetylase [Bacteroidia bacterium]